MCQSQGYLVDESSSIYLGVFDEAHSNRLGECNIFGAICCYEEV